MGAFKRYIEGYILKGLYMGPFKRWLRFKSYVYMAAFKRYIDGCLLKIVQMGAFKRYVDDCILK